MLKLKNLKLGQKFTLLLLIVFLSGIILSGTALASILNYNAQNQISSKALMLIETMNSVRDYTSNNVRPQIADKLETEFLAESVPAYSAREVFETLRANPAYGDFFYKEATLNPTNLRDQADDFETQKIVNPMREGMVGDEVQGFRKSPAGDLFYIARPITIKKESCLECHSTPDAAPQSMIDRYGTEHGFGWELGEIVGAQVISVPASQVLKNSRQSWLLIMGAVAIVFAVTIFLVNLWLKRYVVKPINKMAIAADAASMGDADASFEKTSNDEVGKLADSFSRMQTSMIMAMNRLKKYRISRDPTPPPEA